jgi:hypothetical protein
MALYADRKGFNLQITKKVLCLISTFMLTMSFFPISVLNASAAIGYSLRDGVLTITSQGVLESYSSPSDLPWYDERDTITSLVIPEGVTEIGMNDFTGLTALKTVTFPSSLKKIGKNAFSKCSALETLTFNDGLESIDSSAFAYCSSLTYFTLPESLIDIGSSAFYECTDITDVTIPSNVTVLNENTFALCSSLETINIKGRLLDVSGGVLGGTKWYSSQPEWVILQDEFLLGYRGNEKDLTIPDGITSICDRAFGWSDVNTVKLSDSVSVMGDSVFISTPITSIDLNQVKIIGSHAFDQCTKLTELHLPDSVVEIGECFAQGCKELEDLKLSDSLVTIPQNAFSSCISIQSLEIPTSVHSIEKYAFSKCESLEKIVIPESVASIGDSAIGYNGLKVSDVLTIYGVENSIAQSYAEENNIKFSTMSTTYILGDCNLDGIFNVSDVVLLQKWLLVVPGIHLTNWKAADFCKDDKLDVFDLCLMKRALIDQSSSDC